MPYALYLMLYTYLSSLLKFRLIGARAVPRESEPTEASTNLGAKLKISAPNSPKPLSFRPSGYTIQSLK